MQTDARYSLEDALQNLHRMDLKLWKALVASSPSGVDVMPAPPDSLLPATPIARKMPQMLRFWRMHYDFTVLDLGHGITPALIDVLEVLDTLILVTTNEVLALRQAKQMIQSLAARNFGANRLKLVINRMPKRAQIEIPELEKVMGHTIYAEIPNDYQKINEAYSEPRLVDPNSEIGTRMRKLAAKLAGVNSDQPTNRKFFGLVGKKK
jgi:pilus assembly protein CpaE